MVRRASILLIGTSVLGAALYFGCSPEKHYDTLSFFFDGVPDPNAPSIDGFGGATIRIEHRPFTDDQCLKCHVNPTDIRIDRNDSSMCLQCHEGIQEQYAFMHGPVAATACLWCHHPHHSAFDNLLRRPSPDLCLTCHGDLMAHRELPDLSTDPKQMPINLVHSDLSQDCLACHSGHGGANQAMLHSLPTTPPATQTVTGSSDDAPS